MPEKGIMLSNLVKPRRRYGALRPHHAQLLEWCAEGIEIALMAARLNDMGVSVTLPNLWSHCERHGWLLIHPYSTHYDSVVAYQFSQGGITVEELLKKRK